MGSLAGISKVLIPALQNSVIFGVDLILPYKS